VQFVNFKTSINLSQTISPIMTTTRTSTFDNFLSITKRGVRDSTLGGSLTLSPLIYLFILEKRPVGEARP
jgi:hypothetical protein